MGEYADYYRIREKVPRDWEAVHRSLQQGYGTEHPEKIHGYAGFFFETGNVYVSGTIVQFWYVERLRDSVFHALSLFEQKDYGEISEGDLTQDIENVYLFGGDVFGRYGYYWEDDRQKNERFDEVFRIRTWKGNTWISYDSDPDLFLLLDKDAEIPDISERPDPFE